MDAMKTYNEQIGNARRLISVIMGVPESRRPMITAIATAYIDGIEAGARLTDAACEEKAEQTA